MFATASHLNHAHISRLPHAVHYESHVPDTRIHQQQQPTPPSHPTAHQPRMQPPQALKDPVTVIGVPSVSIENNQLVVGSAQTCSQRSYTLLKVLGDGSFGTVWLCDWHGALPPNTPLSPMQCGPRPEWAGKRLVAIKRMKKKWEGGWDECKKLKELESLRAIPFHPNIIPLYDFFLQPDSKELYFVFESMEGNLYHLIKTRKGKALAGGLVSSIFRQMVAGLHHIHHSGYFHRDMKPENVLVTTTGLFDYQPVSPHASPQSDVVAIIKLADFGLARETKSNPPYTEYVSTRWYRAPEVLLLSRDYSTPVDMWALGTIMAELVNLRPLFPGSGQIDQVARICEIMGNPSDEYGFDAYGKPLGGGKWSRGIKLAKAVGFAFPQIHPKDIYAMFDRTVPLSLIQCIIDLLRYDPEARLTSRQCLDHPYLRETTPFNSIPLPDGMHGSIPGSTIKSGFQPLFVSSPASSRDIPPSHSHSHHPIPSHAYTPPPSNLHSPIIPDAATTHRTLFYNGNAAHGNGAYQDGSTTSSTWTSSIDTHNGDYPMEITPSEVPDEFVSMDIQTSPIARDHPSRPHPEPRITAVQNHHDGHHHSHGSKFSKFSFGKKPSKWTLFGGGHGDKSSHQHQQQHHTHGGLPVVEENTLASSSSNSLQRQASNGSNKSMDPSMADTAMTHADKQKMNKKEAERLRREAEIQRRLLAEKAQKEQARAVMQKRKLLSKTTSNPLEWSNGLNGYDPNDQHQLQQDAKGKAAAAAGPKLGANLSIIGAAAGIYSNQNTVLDWKRETERLAKRRREFDDDRSSSDVHSVGHVSTISFATVDSDPGPSRIRKTPSSVGISRMTSTSSLRTSAVDDFASARSSNSFSLDGQLANDFRLRAAMDPYSGTLSPPPMHSLSLSSSSTSPSATPSQPWPQEHCTNRNNHPPFLSLSTNVVNPVSPHSNINPIFKVPPLASTSLPPFSQLEAVAEGEYPPLSPMSFTSPDDD